MSKENSNSQRTVQQPDNSTKQTLPADRGNELKTLAVDVGKKKKPE